MLSNLEVNCYNLLILTTFVPSCTVWGIFQAVWDLNIRDSLKFLHRNSVKYSIHSFAIERGCFFLKSLPLTNRSSELLPSVFNGVPNSLINRFQECFHPYFSIGIVVPIKVRWDHKRVIVFHDNKSQGSTLRSKDLNIRANILWYHLYIFRLLKTQVV